MPALTPDTIRTLTETLSDLTDYLRENPDPVEASPSSSPSSTNTRACPSSSPTPCAPLPAPYRNTRTRRAPRVDLLITELRTAAWEQTDQHTLHYVLDDLRDLYGSSSASEQGCCWCR